MVAPAHTLPNEKAVVTREDVFALQALPENADKTIELIFGELTIMPGASILHTLIITRLLKMLGDYLVAHPIGLALTDGAMYDLPNGDLVIPDGSFVAAGRYDEADLPIRFALAPDLAIEVMSPSNTDAQMAAKIDAYLGAGVRLVWVIYPERRTVSVYHTKTDGTITYRSLSDSEMLSGDDILPELSVPIGAIFTAPSKPTS